MAKSPRYLTKSRFKSALECPTKLYYTRKEEIYANKSKQDKFLKVLAEGGYQVGELAKYYHPDGCEVLSDGDDDQLKETSELLQKQKVIIYEPAIKFENFFMNLSLSEFFITKSLIFTRRSLVFFWYSDLFWIWEKYLLCSKISSN